MAKGRFNKRAGGARLDAENADEIEARNAKLEEVEAQREKRRAEAAEEDEEDGDGEGDQKAEESKDTKKDDKKQQEPAGPVTTEADHKRNMAKLAEVRKRREEAEKRRKAEEEAAKQMEEERKQMAAMTMADDEDGGKKKKKSSIPKLDKIAIKKMKPTQMKEALKLRGLDIQGNAKALQQRLLDYEAKR